ncbi:MAG: RNA polymerase sigma factor [Lachnospiraceae bacterium]|nr:RNA polymerase sigma factor [Lachnospiraceae bacterium]
MDIDFLFIQRMRMGDERALETFVKNYYPLILRYCQIHIADYNYAEDMTQETFARFFQNLRKYKHYGKAVNYLYAIAANVCNDYYRKNKEIPMDELPDIPDLRNDSLDSQLDIYNALQSLSSEIRDVAILYFLQERKQKDISKILGISLPLVKYRVRRAKKLLLDYFRKENI